MNKDTNSKIEYFVRSLRRNRTFHRVLGLLLALFLFVSAITGVLLSWKKEATWIQPSTQKAEKLPLSEWLSLDSLSQIATYQFYKAYPQQNHNTINRIDVRPSKGIAKVLFKEGNWEVQIEGSTGNIRSIAKRHSDWIEALHDGSIISDNFKLISMNLLGIGLVILLLSGFWLWFGPKKIRQLKRR